MIGEPPFEGPSYQENLRVVAVLEEKISARLTGASGLVIRIPEPPDVEKADAPYLLIACTRATTVAPQVRLYGVVLNVLTGTKQESVDKAEAVDPSQKLSSGVNVVPSLCKIKI
jgi:hypothetical protein